MNEKKELSEAAKAALRRNHLPQPPADLAEEKTWWLTYEIRWLIPNSPPILRLQQKWVCPETQEVEWRDVPTVTE